MLKIFKKHYPCLYSTQTKCFELLKNSKHLAKKYDYVQVSADNQKEGKGRAGSEWSHGSGNIACSIGFQVGNDPVNKLNFDNFKKIERYRWVPHAMGYAVSSVLGDGYRIKWPNDIYSAQNYQNGDGEEPEQNLENWKKVGGILVESEFYQDGKSTNMYIVVGLGLNTTSLPENSTNFAALRHETFQNYSSQNDLLLEQITEKMHSTLQPMLSDYHYVRAMENIIEIYNENMLFKDKMVKVTQKDVEDSLYHNIEGKLMGLNQYGGINIQTGEDAFVPVKEMMSLHLLEDQSSKF